MTELLSAIANKYVARDEVSPMPVLSVIVPVYNSTAYLQKCLAAFAQSSYRKFEVIVVDDGSTEPIEPLVSEFGFKYLRIDGPRGPARARNRGAVRACGSYLVFVDADVCVHADTLERFAALFASDFEVDAVIGAYDDSPSEPNFISQYKNLFHHYVHQSSDGRIYTFWSGCGAIKRDVFLAFGGFDERRYRRPAIEDIELGTWMSAAGRRIILDRRIKGKHLKRWTFRNLLKSDIFDRGVPWTRLMLRAGAAANTLNVKSDQRLSVILVYLAQLLLLASIWRPMALLIMATLVIAVILINFDFYRYFSSRRGWWFTLRSAPLHWLYFGYCGFSVWWGTMLHFLERETTSTSHAADGRWLDE
jgi:glycosyltransferase involved in cell wall biosynthesis